MGVLVVVSRPASSGGKSGAVFLRIFFLLSPRFLTPLSPSPKLQLTDADRRRMADTLPSEPRRREDGGRKGVTWAPPAADGGGGGAVPAVAVRAGPGPPSDSGGSCSPAPDARRPVDADRPRRRVDAVPAVPAGAPEGGRPAEPVAAEPARRVVRRVDTPGVGSG